MGPCVVLRLSVLTLVAASACSSSASSSGGDAVDGSAMSDAGADAAADLGGDDGGGAEDAGDLGSDAGATDPDEAPCGVYLLSTRDESGPSVRFRGDRDLPYVDGFIIRPFWPDLEPEAGRFDFSFIDDAMARMEAQDQHLTIQILGAEPDHVVAEAVDTWVWFDPNPRRSGDCADEDGCVRALPWDARTRERQDALLRALADHPVAHDGAMVRLAEHPRLDQLLLPLVGWGRIRELGFEVEEWPGYSRERLVEATREVVAMHYGHFPGQPHQLQLFPVLDAPRGEGTPLWEDLVAASLAAAGDAPAPIFLMENLVHRVTEGEDVFAPGPTRGGAPLLAAAEAGGFVGFQMLTAWSRPFPGQEDAVAGGNPMAAMRWAMDTYGARYFEVYTVDVDAAEAGTQPWREDLVSTSAELCAPAP